MSTPTEGKARSAYAKKREAKLAGASETSESITGTAQPSSDNPPAGLTPASGSAYGQRRMGAAAAAARGLASPSSKLPEAPISSPETRSDAPSSSSQTLTGFRLSKSSRAELSESRLTARLTKRDSSSGIIEGDFPLPSFIEGSYFEIRVDEVTSGADSGLVLGVTSSPPGMPEVTIKNIPMSWVFGHNGQMTYRGENPLDVGFKAISWKPQSLRVGDLVGICVNTRDEVCLLHNNQVISKASQKVPSGNALYAILELCGNTRAVSLLPSIRPPPSMWMSQSYGQIGKLMNFVRKKLDTTGDNFLDVCDQLCTTGFARHDVLSCIHAVTEQREESAMKIQAIVRGALARMRGALSVVYKAAMAFGAAARAVAGKAAVVLLDRTLKKIDDDSTKGWPLPSHWQSQTRAGGHLVPVDGKLLATLQSALETDPNELGRGRDVRESGKYSSLLLVRAWRLEHPNLWRRYACERQSMTEDIQLRKLHPPMLKVQPNLASSIQDLPDEPLQTTVNETYLFHGTKPENLLALLSSGLNERFSGGLFGFGTYLAEDPGKSDQYVTEDKRLSNDLKALHQKLYVGGVSHPKDVYYVLLCRTAMGYYVTTQDMPTGAGDIFANDGQRELRCIPGLPKDCGPMHYHSLIAETGGVLKRYREFVQYHSERIYPAYLLAYQRRSGALF